MTESVFKRVSAHLSNNKFVVTIGGEHSVSFGAAKAHAKKYKNMTVLQLDAHSDLRSQYENSKYNHACVMARIKEVSPIVQVGIRSMDYSEKGNMDKKRVFFARDIIDNDKWMDNAIKLISDNVYLTIDLDVFDPSILPSTGTPEPGGLNWYKVLNFIIKVINERQLVGFDVVELCPNKQNKAKV